MGSGIESTCGIEMIYNWDGYINSQRYFECQVISALNAYYYLTGEVIEQFSEEYEYLVDLALARNGATISVEKVYDYLDIVVVDIHKALPKFAPFPFPMDVSVWSKYTGYHSVLIIGKKEEGKLLQVTNFMWVTDEQGLIGYYDFRKYIRSTGINGEYWGRVLGIRDA